MYIKKAFALCAGLVSIFLVEAGAAQAQEKVVIRMDWAPSGVHAPFHLALDKGWFKEEGLDVELQDGKGSSNTAQLVATGEVDIGEITVGILPAARESGMMLKVVAGIARKGALAVVVPEESEIKTAADLKGKKVLLFAASPWTPFVDPFFENAGMQTSDVNMTYVDPAALLPTYASGNADAFMTLGPGAAHMMKTRPSRAINAADYGITFPDHGLIVNEEYLASNPETIRKVVKVAVRAWEYMLDGHEDEGIEAVIKNRPDHNLDPDILLEHFVQYKAYLDTDNTVGKPFGWQSPEDWEAAVETLSDAGVVTEKLDPTTYYTNEFLPGEAQ